MASHRFAAWIPIGVAVGVSAGIALDRLPLGVAFGLVGWVVAMALQRRRQGRS